MEIIFTCYAILSEFEFFFLADGAAGVAEHPRLPLHGAVPRQRLSIPLALPLRAVEGGGCALDGRWAESYPPFDGAEVLQVRPEL